jgi:hypothetical protein
MNDHFADASKMADKLVELIEDAPIRQPGGGE